MSFLPPLASLPELAGVTGKPVADLRLAAALRDASRRFRGAVHHDVSLVEGETIELDGSGSSVLLLPALPVVSIQSLELQGVALELNVDYRLSKRRGILERTHGRSWSCDLGAVELTYTHGYDATPVAEAAGTDGVPAGSLPHVPGDIQAAVLEMAQILLNVDVGVQSKTVLGDTTSFGSAAVGATQQWSDAVSNYVIHLGS